MKENWIDRLVKEDYFSTVRRFTVAALLGVSSVVGSGAFIVMGVVAPLISGSQHYFEKKRKQKMLLNFYADEFGAILHKKPDDLNLEDLEKNSKPFTALREPYDEYQKTQIVSVGIAVVSSLITVAALLGAAVLAGPELTLALPNILQLGLVTAGYMAIRNTVSATAHSIFKQDDSCRCVTEKLMELSENLKAKPINPVQVFSIFVEANPKLQADVKQRYGKDFDHLSAMRKKDVVDAYEAEYRVGALTNALNHDQIKTSLVGFLAYNQAEGLPGFAQYKALFSAPLEKGPEVKMSDYPKIEKKPEHIKRLQDERDEEVALTGRILN